MSTLQTTFIQKLGAGTDAFEIPANDGTSGQYLQTDGTGGLSWQTIASLSNAEDGAGTDFEFNSGFGSNATAYGVRAWARINGTGTISEYGKGGFSSITDQSTGVYRFNFTNAMPDTNYAVAGSTDGNTIFQVNSTFNTGYIDTNIQTTSATAVDSDDVSIVVVR